MTLPVETLDALFVADERVGNAVLRPATLAHLAAMDALGVGVCGLVARKDALLAAWVLTLDYAGCVRAVRDEKWTLAAFKAWVAKCGCTADECFLAVNAVVAHAASTYVPGAGGEGDGGSVYSTPHGFGLPQEVADVRGRFGDVFTDAMMDVIRAYNEERSDAAANTECHVVGRPCRIHDKAQGGVPKRNDGLDEFTRQERKFKREQEYLDQFKASDDHPTCEEVVGHTVPELMKDLERGFTADFGGGHKVVFCLKNLVEKYGDERSSKFDLSRLRALRIALARRYSFASIPHRGNQVAFIEQGRMPAGVNRIVIVASRHGNDLVARNVMRNTDDYVRSSFKFNPC